MAYKNRFIALICSLILLSALLLSCTAEESDTKSKDFSGRSQYYALNLSFSVWLKTNDAAAATTATGDETSDETFSDNIDWIVTSEQNSLTLRHKTEYFIITIKQYPKYSMAEAGVTDTTSFIDFYKKFDGKPLYESGVSETVLDVNAGLISGTPFKSGKRQLLKSPEGSEDAVTWELIYLDSEENFYTISYGNASDKFDSAKTTTEELIGYITEAVKEEAS
ncbi:hypothetical protein FACS1894219_12390 [Clostridia bacterium]|nr:hypothetical protein FACS1894219_12390 [Clostridia bacterium]